MKQFSLGIECGGTRSLAVLFSKSGREIASKEFGCGNFQLLNRSELRALFAAMGAHFPNVKAVGIAMAGLRKAQDQCIVREAVFRIWQQSRCYVGDDLEPLLAELPKPKDPKHARIVVISGTGFSCLGRNADGAEARIGGWGQCFGDEAGAYGIAIEALRQTTRRLDISGKAPPLLVRLLRALSLKSPRDISSWAAQATKGEIARLASLVFDDWKRGDAFGKSIIEKTATRIISDALACANRLGEIKRIQFILSGACFQKQSEFAERVREGLFQNENEIKTEVILSKSQGAKGAMQLAILCGQKEKVKNKMILDSIIPKSSALSPTECRLEESMHLDRLSICEGIALMLNEESKLPSAILSESPKLAQLIRWMVQGFRQNARWIYVGAGTSGRLGVLDASECPPTFRTNPERILGMIAGGRAALWQSIEGAEDDVAGGEESIHALKIKRMDVVIGIAASGRTPFVWGAISAAQKAGAKTALICFNPHLEFHENCKPDVVICPEIGAEVLTGSTRLKAGTATKIILNLISTLSMVQLGKVRQNLMIDLAPSNEKLRARAIRILAELTQCSAALAKETLESESWNIKAAARQLATLPMKDRRGRRG